MTPLILKFFLDKLVWFKYSSSLMKGIYVIPVAVAWGPVPVLATSYWFSCCCCYCGAIPFSYVTSSGARCSCWLVRALFSCCFLELRSCPTLVFSNLHQSSNFSTKNSKCCKAVLYSLVPYPHFSWYLHMLFVSIWSAFFWYYVWFTSSVYPKLCQR